MKERDRERERERERETQSGHVVTSRERKFDWSRRQS